VGLGLGVRGGVGVGGRKEGSKLLSLRLPLYPAPLLTGIITYPSPTPSLLRFLPLSCPPSLPLPPSLDYTRTVRARAYAETGFNERPIASRQNNESSSSVLVTHLEARDKTQLCHKIDLGHS
jgi:hypothetical protein